MNLYQQQSHLIFCVTLILTLFSPPLFPACHLFFFVPFLITSFYQKSLSSALWHAMICGVILDTINTHITYGLYAASFLLTTLILYPQKRHFFADHLTTMPIMTFIFSSLSTLLLCLFQREVFFSAIFITTDLFLMPLMDALYAFGFFTLPVLLFGKPIRKGKDYFMERGID